MGVFALIAVAALVLLYDVRFNEGAWWFEGVSNAASRSAMTLLLLALEAMAFTGVLFLLLIRPYRRSAALTEEWTSTGGALMEGDSTVIQIGCPGCGTVFEKPLTSVDEPHEQDFRCPNCGRAGRLRMGLHKPVTIRDAACISCGQGFKAYRDTAECPHCHAPQA
ncbi:MAG: hypothetical protein AABY18_03270 [Candidatus Thermoplasmatota archaeon]